MESVFGHMALEDSDDELDADYNPEPLGEQESKLIVLIKELIQKRKYKDIPLLFTTGKNASTNVEMLPKMSMHLYREICDRYLTEDTYADSFKLYKCAEEMLQRIAGYAPVDEFLYEMIHLVGPESPECVFVSALSVLESPLLRVPDHNKMSVFEDCLDEIVLRRDVYAPMPKYLLMGNSVEIDIGLETDDDLQYLITFHIRVREFYAPLLKQICAIPRPEAEIFRSCKSSKRNVMCCFLIKMLEKPLSLFDLRFCEAKAKTICPLFFAVALTRSITKCIGNPFFLLNFVEQKVRWSFLSRLAYQEEEDGNHFLKEFTLEMECVAIYYYMVIVEGVDATQVPKVYHPLYVCEMGLYLVHYLLSDLPSPALYEKALRLATKLLANLRHIKIPSAHLDLFIYKAFLNDLRKLSLKTVSANILMLAVNTLKQFVLCFVDEDKYFMLKTLMETINHPGFRGFLINLYKELARDALQAASTAHLIKVFSGQHLHSIFLEHICKLQHGVKTDPGENFDQIEAALETLFLFATLDVDNRSGFWSIISEINSKFISPLRKSLKFYEARFKTELHNALQGRGFSGKRSRGGKTSQSSRSKQIETLKSNLTSIAILRKLMPMVCDSLANVPTIDKSNLMNSS